MIVQHGSAVLDVGVKIVFRFLGLGAGFEGTGLVLGLDLVARDGVVDGAIAQRVVGLLIVCWAVAI